jgi:hypothetical protein
LHLNGYPPGRVKVRRHRPGDFGPIRNSRSGVHVGSGDEPAREALKVGLSTAVAVVTEATGRTGTARVAWINHDNTHACQRRLVAHKLAQLPKGPTAVATTLRMANRHSLSKMRKLFKCEGLASFRRLCNQAFADHVVCVLLKAPLFAGEVAQPAPAVLCADRLQALASKVVAAPYLFDLIATECLTVAVGGKVDDTEVNAQHTQWLVWFWQPLGLCDAQIPYDATADQLSTTDLPGQVVKVLPLEVAQVKLADDAPMQRVEAHPIQWHQTVGARIVANAAVSTKGGTRFMVVGASSAYRFGGFVSGTAGKLRTKSKLSTSCAVDGAMERVLVGDALLPRDGSAIRCGGIKRDLRLTQLRISSAINAQFAAYSTCGDGITHSSSIPQVKVAAFLRHLKEAVSSRSS